MKWLAFTVVCLLLYIPSVLSLPLVPKTVPDVEQSQDKPIADGDGESANSFDTVVVQYIKPPINSGSLPPSDNHAQKLPNFKSNKHLKDRDIQQDSPTSHLSNKTQQLIKPLVSQTNSTVPRTAQPQHPENLKYGANQNHSSSDSSESKLSADGQHQVEYKITSDNPRNLQLAVNSDLGSQGEGHKSPNETLLTVGSGLAALFSLGLVIGLFSCCCPKKSQSSDVELKEAKPVNNDKPLSQSQKPSQVFNTRYSMIYTVL